MYRYCYIHSYTYITYGHIHPANRETHSLSATLGPTVTVCPPCEVHARVRRGETKRERDRERERGIYIYIWKERKRERERET